VDDGPPSGRQKRRKASPTERAYFDDVEGWMTGALNAAVRDSAVLRGDGMKGQALRIHLKQSC